jgi:drug/metabolite transporter (DMT)-like permease
VLPVAIGLSAAVCIGVADFAAGIAARRVTPVLVGFWSQAVSVVLTGLLLLVLRPPLAPGQAPWGLFAGLATGIGLALLYRAMAVGAISLVGPITACSVVLPVVYSVARGEPITTLAAAGTVAIITGVVLASLQGQSAPGDSSDTNIGGERRAVVLAVAAAVAFGIFFILIDLSPQASGWGTLWTAATARLSSFGVQAGLVALGRRRPSWPGGAMPIIALAGILDQASLVLLGLGAMTGAYGIVTALMGLYPLVMVLLGVLLLRERLTPLQATGAALAITGVMLVSV